MGLKGVCFWILLSCLAWTQIAGAADPLEEQAEFQEQLQEHQQPIIPKDDTVYGWQLMSEQERIQYREQLHMLKTEKERERYRYLHREKMQERVEEQGRIDGYRQGSDSQQEMIPGKPSGGGGGRK